MSNNPAKYEVLIKQYVRSILDINCNTIWNFLGKVLKNLKIVEIPKRGLSNQNSGNLNRTNIPGHKLPKIWVHLTRLLSFPEI